MKTALVYDRINKWGGAERVLLALHEIWPDAPLYTAVYDPKGAPWASVFDVRPSFLQSMPLARTHHEFYPWLTTMAFESFSFDEFDVVISITSAEAKSIITKHRTLHICYCLTPTRYLWSGYELYLHSPGFGLFDGAATKVFNIFAPTLKRWDLIASHRPDHYIAISAHVANRIKTYYHRDVEKVIYPPVNIKQFTAYTRLPAGQGSQPTVSHMPKDYFLVVSRLVPYKRIDLIVRAFNNLGWPLVIIGDGSEISRLKTLARNNIRFIRSNLTDRELVDYYGRCRALVVAADEDFGLTAVEALMSGKPVIAYRQSGIAEIVEGQKTGLFFDMQSTDALVSALHVFEKRRFDQEACQRRGELFNTERFAQEMRQTVDMLYNTL